MTYDAILLVSFGGPEKPEDVMPFLENVLRGKMFLASAWRQWPSIISLRRKSPINEQIVRSSRPCSPN